MEVIKSIPLKMVECVDGSLGYYVKSTEQGHLIRIPNKHWPFPEHVFLKRDQFKYVTEKLLEEFDEAPF